MIVPPHTNLYLSALCAAGIRVTEVYKIAESHFLKMIVHLIYTRLAKISDI